MMQFRPLHDRILVKRQEAEEKSPGGIYIPDNAKERPVQGEIVAAGNGKLMEDGMLRPLEVKVGETVLFGKYAGTEIKIDGEEFTILRQDEVLGVLSYRDR